MVEILIDTNTQKKMLTESQKIALLKNPLSLLRYADSNYEFHSRNEFLEFTLKNPYIALNMIEQSKIKNEDKIRILIDRMLSKRGRIDLITADKRGGKTALMFYLAWKLHEKGEKIAWFGPPVELPDFIKTKTLKIENLPTRCTVLMDEISVQFFNRISGQENLDFIRTLPIISHSARNIIACTQSTSINDLNFLRLATSLIFKSKTSFNIETERTEITTPMRMFMPNKVNEFLYYDSTEKLPLIYASFPLPPFWKEDYSTLYRPFRNDYEKYKFIIECLKELDLKEVVEQTNLKGGNTDINEVWWIYSLLEMYPDLNKMEENEFMRIIRSQFNATSIQDEFYGRVDERTPNFYLSPIQRIEAENEPTSLRKVNLIFLEELINRYRNEGNVIISVYGYPGTGKSWMALSIAELLLKIFNSDAKFPRIYYTDQEILDDLENIKKGETIIKDEQVRLHGEGSGREMEEMSNIEQTIRQEMINFIWVSPVLKPHLDFFTIKTFGIDKKLGKSRALLYSKELLGHIILNKPSDKLIEHYKKLKEEFLKKVKSRKIRQTDYDKMAMEVMEDEEFSEDLTKRQIHFLVHKHFPHLTVFEKEVITERIKMILKKSTIPS